MSARQFSLVQIKGEVCPAAEERPGGVRAPTVAKASRFGPPSGYVLGPSWGCVNAQQKRVLSPLPLPFHGNAQPSWERDLHRGTMLCFGQIKLFNWLALQNCLKQ